MQYAEDRNLIKQRSICLTGSLVAALWSLRQDSCTSTSPLGTGSPHSSGADRRSSQVEACMAFTRHHRQLLSLPKAPWLARGTPPPWRAGAQFLLLGGSSFRLPAQAQRQLSCNGKGHCINVAVGRTRTAGQENGR